MTPNTATLNGLPEGWRSVTLGDVAKISLGVTPKRSDYADSGLKIVKFRDVSDQGIDWLNNDRGCVVPGSGSAARLRELRAGDVLLTASAHSPEAIGKKTCYVREIPPDIGRAFYVGELLNVRADTSVILPRWSLFWFQSPAGKEAIGEAVYGVHLTAGRARGIRIPLPPLDEQRRIVARVEALFERMEEAQRLRLAGEHNAERLMPAALVEILDEAESQYQCRTIGKLAHDGVLEIVGGGTPSKKNPAFWSGTIPWVSPKDMKRWIIDDTEDHITSQAIDRSSAKLIPEGAVLVVVRGMILARTWPVAVAGTELTINQDMKALHPSNGLIPEYLGYVLRGSEPEVLNRVETAAHGTKRLRTATLEAVEIPILPLSEQRRIVHYLDGVQAQVAELKRLQAASAAELARLEGAVLARAFRGEL
jgi:type I restriction enzyme S subunit